MMGDAVEDLKVRELRFWFFYSHDGEKGELHSRLPLATTWSILPNRSAELFTQCSRAPASAMST